MIKFLADESVDFRIIAFLREKGYEVVAVVENYPGISDEEVLTYSNQLEAIIFTEDKDFGELTFRFRRLNPGIVLIRLSGVDIESKRRTIQRVLEEHEAELTSRFTVISRDKVRMRWQDHRANL